jgi:hypothetical protein
MKKAKQSSEVLKVGDSVNWRGNWGSHPPKIAVVSSILLGTEEEPTDSIEWEKVNTRDVITCLDNGHWAYGNQLSRL